MAMTRGRCEEPAVGDIVRGTLKRTGMNADTRRHIDAARQILVGVVPNPTSQIEQITNALIYKFMDDMDQSAIKAGGKASFFVGELEQYRWSKLMSSSVGSQERMNLYSEALIKFSNSKNLPDLFRDIFKAAYLPYRSPSTLDLFLREINYFDYSHPEELGNAYEYLLSIMSSQGAAGQFRTPRHIIDFIVEVVNPTKDDKILDPACGTAGFLISAYNHIRTRHDGLDESGTKKQPLTPEDKKKLRGNFSGYDIDPTMVRIAQVNMYLHHFKDPQIFQYDSLSQEERWGDLFDVVLANPPFMSPKGGITPHKKFSMQSSRSEVLFVDYIMSHLRPKGRAGIIVPEGIIFQSGTAYKELRKKLVEDGLFAVASLPSGVFQPYSGVKTSVLLFDTEMGKHHKEILFVKIENDGFDLGAQRREKTGSNLPEAAKVLIAWRKGEKIESKLAHWVAREKIAEDGDYNLSGDRYRVATDYCDAKWPMVELGEVCEINPRKSEISVIPSTTEVSFVPMADVEENSPYFEPKQVKTIADVASSYTYFRNKDVLLAKVTPCFENGKAGIARGLKNGIGFGSSELIVLRPSEKVLPELVYRFVTSADFRDTGVLQMTGTGGLQRIPTSFVTKYKIPLPPIEIQEQIVAELDGYAGIIAGAKQIVQNWKPKIDIDPAWEKVKLGAVCDPEYGFTDMAKAEGDVRFIRITDIAQTGEFLQGNPKYINLSKESKKYLLEKGDLLVARTGATFGKTLLFKSGEPSVFASFLLRLRFPKEKVLPEYYWSFAQSDAYWEQANQLVTGGGQPQFNGGALKQIAIPLPPITIQKQIVDKIEAERALVESAKKMIEIYEQKTKEVIAKIWRQ